MLALPLVLAGLLLPSACGGGGSSADRNSSGGGNRVFHDSTYGFQFVYPAGFRARDFYHDYGMVSFKGVVTTNAVAQRKAIVPYSGDLSTLPARSVVFLVQHLNGGPEPGLDMPEAHFPLRAASFEPVRGVTLPKGSFWRQYGISANGWNLEADVYFGPRASKADRAAIWRVVSSLRFKSLRTGQRTGEGRFLVLLKQSSYPIGFVKRITANTFLVRASHGFYGIGGLAYSVPSTFPCRVRFVRSKFEFVCVNGSRRWDRMGRPLWKGASWRDNLGVLVAVKVGQDGHVLFCPNETAFGDGRLERKYWGNKSL